MAFTHGKATEVLGAEFDFSSWLNSTDIDGEIETAETTTYGTESKTYIAGLADGTLSFGGLYDSGATDAQNAALDAMLQSTNGEPWTAAPSGIVTPNACRLANGRLTTYGLSSPVGDVVGLSISIQATGGVHVGTVLHGIDAAETATGNEASVDDGAATTDGAVGALHLIEFTGTDLQVSIQHSPNDSTFADLIAFGSLGAVGSEWGEASGSVDRYIRAEWAGTFTTATFAVSFARN